MAWRVKTLATKPDNLSSLPGSLTVEERTDSGLHPHGMACMPPHSSTHTAWHACHPTPPYTWHGMHVSPLHTQNKYTKCNRRQNSFKHCY